MKVLHDQFDITRNYANMGDFWDISVIDKHLDILSGIYKPKSGCFLCITPPVVLPVFSSSLLGK